MMLPVTEIGAGLLATSGAFAWVSPQTNLPGFKDYDTLPGFKEYTTTAIVRAIGAWQIGLASVLLAGKHGVTVGAGYGLYAASASALAVVPAWEMLGREKSSQVGAILVFALLGSLTLAGRASPLISAAAYLLAGLSIYFTPKSTAGLYKLNKPVSTLGYSMISLYGGVIATAGIYLAALAQGLAQPVCFAVAFGVNAFISLKFAVVDAGKVGCPKAGPLIWAAVSAVLSGLALK